ncbi:MAG: 2-(1,2-epoxy-1,2-dihydrophenyl)acetyl-CoA isomerase [Alphaproteobacteria bacterium]|nr:MAG: 2-(1,2-epoxy-1,2-dihydrophenyl)acetyl-CoA isomerase [Alphaproteobacteria bacterium]
MSYETIIYDLESDVATITLNRPEQLNAMTAQMRVDLLHALRRAEGEARVAVLTGAGRAFCSGQDLGQRQNAADVDLQRTLIEEYHPLIEALAGCPIPTIAAVNGAAAGAGANLALAADVVIAAESAYFMEAFARIGLVPDAGGTYWLPRSMGLAKAMGAALFAEKIPAAQAEAWGMIWEVVPDEQFPEHVAARAVQLARGPTRAFALMKSVLRRSFANDLAAQLEAEASAQGEAGRSEDYLEGVMAFMEKRAAVFRGR